MKGKEQVSEFLQRSNNIGNVDSMRNRALNLLKLCVRSPLFNGAYFIIVAPKINEFFDLFAESVPATGMLHWGSDSWRDAVLIEWKEWQERNKQWCPPELLKKKG